MRDGLARFRYLADRLPVIIWSGRTDGKVDYLNNTAVEFSGLSIEKLMDDGLPKQPFFILVGWTYAHYPTLPSPEFRASCASASLATP